MIIFKNVLFLCAFLSYSFNEVLSQELDGDPASLPDQGICTSKHIINGPKNLEVLRNCSVIDGDLKIVLFDRNFDDKDYENISFPNLREVTDYLLVYRIYGLRTLAQLFPNLSLIRGRNLLVNYAFSIFECKNFQEIGLKSLSKIMRGSVRIQNNPQMCFDQSVDWEKITGTKDGHIFVGNAPPGCPGRESCRGCEGNYCWNSRSCQKMPSPDCHPECLDTCDRISKKCSRCRNWILDNLCVKECPPDRYEFESTRHCLTKELCKKMYFDRGWVWNGKCVNKCPKHFESYRTKRGEKSCRRCSRLPCLKECAGGEINTISDAELFKGCTHINESLQIRMIGVYGPGVMKELEECLGDIEVIKGFLKVYRSTPLTSLKFFKNLTRINGDNLEYNKYSLLAFENPNLQTLWDWDKTKNFTLLNGMVFFQFNPKLCLKEIDILRNLTNSSATIYDVSPDSNGVNITCDYILIQAKSKVIDTQNATITWERFVRKNHDKPVTGYRVYYMEDPEDDVTSYFGRDACFTRTWMSILVPETPNSSDKWMSLNITDLNHSTKYAYYVETYDGTEESHIVDSSSKSGHSDIQYFTTLSELPTQPMELRAVSYTKDSVTIYWSNDPEYRGSISRYVVELHIQPDEQSLLDERNYCKNPLKMYRSAVNEKKMQTQEDLAPDLCNCAHIERTWEKLFMKKATKVTVMTKDGGFYNEMFPTLYGYTLVEDDEVFSNHTKKRRHAGRFNIPKDFNQPLNRPGIENITKNDKFHYFSTEFLSHHQNFTITNLNHFSKYVIYLAACIGPLDTDCGSVAMTVERTLKDEDADKVSEVKVDLINGSSVSLTWNQPEHLNSIILTYIMEYRMVSKLNGQLETVCITREQFEADSNEYILTKLEHGVYKARVKATSLAGSGRFSKFQLFTVKEKKKELHWAAFTFMGIAMLFMAGYVSIYLHRYFACQPEEEEMVLTDDITVRYSVDSDEEERVEIYGID